MFERIPNIPQVLIWQGSKYSWVTQGSGQKAPLKMFDRVLSIPLILKWQGYRKFCVSSVGTLEIQTVKSQF